MQRRDFLAARGYLENAYAADPGKRGVQKVLGYCYVWLGITSGRAAGWQESGRLSRAGDLHHTWW